MAQVPARQLGARVDTSPNTWVQTERAAHEAWAKLTIKSPRSAALMHHLIARMGHQNAVVVSQKTLAKLMGSHRGVRAAHRVRRCLIPGVPRTPYSLY